MRTITTEPLPSFGFNRRPVVSQAREPELAAPEKGTVYVFWGTNGNIRLWTQDKARAEGFQAETGCECFTYHDAPIPGPDGTPGNGQWAKFMSLCRKRGWAPSEMSDMFALMKEARQAAVRSSPAPARIADSVGKNEQLAGRSDAVDSIVLEEGKYTVELSTRNGRFSFTALRNGEAWRDMSSDGDKLMLAMFQQLCEQKLRIEQLEQAAKEPLQKTMRRWDVEEGAVQPLEAEPTYVMKMDVQRGFIDVRPEGVADEHLLDVPHLYVAVEINRGVPCLYVYKDALSGEVEAKYFAMSGELVERLDENPDIQAIGQQIRDARDRPVEAANESRQAPSA
jgi:hypothetical protein